MNQYLISIIITVYNKESTLKRCLKSILKNNDKSSEIVIINDGSTDGSIKVIEK